MTPKIQKQIQHWQTACAIQMNNHHYPLVDSNAAKHQFYGYVAALEQAGYITEDELGDSMEQFCTTLSNESKRTQYSTALQRGINDHGVPCEIMVDNGSYWESFNASKAPKKSPNI